MQKDKMTTKTQRKIIFRAVREACENDIDRSRKYVARRAAIIADRRGVNVASAPYLEEIFGEALDKKEKEGVFDNLGHFGAISEKENEEEENE